MPAVLYFGIYLCECGQIFKRKDHSSKHALSHNHSIKECTLSIDKKLEPSLRKGVAITTYDTIKVS